MLWAGKLGWRRHGSESWVDCCEVEASYRFDLSSFDVYAGVRLVSSFPKGGIEAPLFGVSHDNARVGRLLTSAVILPVLAFTYKDLGPWLAGRSDPTKSLI